MFTHTRTLSFRNVIGTYPAGTIYDRHLRDFSIAFSPNINFTRKRDGRTRTENKQENIIVTGPFVCVCVFFSVLKTHTIRPRPLPLPLARGARSFFYVRRKLYFSRSLGNNNQSGKFLRTVKFVIFLYVFSESFYTRQRPLTVGINRFSQEIKSVVEYLRRSISPPPPSK